MQDGYKLPQVQQRLAGESISLHAISYRQLKKYKMPKKNKKQIKMTIKETSRGHQENKKKSTLQEEWNKYKTIATANHCQSAKDVSEDLLMDCIQSAKDANSQMELKKNYAESVEHVKSAKMQWRQKRMKL